MTTRYRISTHPNGNDLQIEWAEPIYGGDNWHVVTETMIYRHGETITPRRFRDRFEAHHWIDEQILARKGRENNRKPGYEYYP
jgi:hypothetical protein